MGWSGPHRSTHASIRSARQNRSADFSLGRLAQNAAALLMQDARTMRRSFWQVHPPRPSLVPLCGCPSILVRSSQAPMTKPRESTDNST